MLNLEFYKGMRGVNLILCGVGRMEKAVVTRIVFIMLFVRYYVKIFKQLKSRLVRIDRI